MKHSPPAPPGSAADDDAAAAAGDPPAAASDASSCRRTSARRSKATSCSSRRRTPTPPPSSRWPPPRDGRRERAPSRRAPSRTSRSSTTAWSDAGAGPAENPWNPGDDERAQDFADARGATLQEHLLWQLDLPQLSAREQAIGARDHRCHQRRRLPRPIRSRKSRATLQPEIDADAAEVDRVLRASCRRSIRPAWARAASANAWSCSCGMLDPATPGLATARCRSPQSSGPGRRPRFRAAAPRTARQRRRTGAGPGAGARLPSAPRLGVQLGGGRVRGARCVRAPHRARLVGRDQSGHRCRGYASTRATPS